MPTVRELTPLRAEPDAGAEQVTQALPGEPLTVLETDGGWAKVCTAYDYPGWLPETALADEEPEDEWPAVDADDPLEAARRYLGSRYEWGGMTERGIDCSGLVHMAFRRIGRLVPRDADQQEDVGLPLRDDELRPGDLITYGPSNGRADHIAFWLGDGRILHSTQRGGVDGVIEEEEPEELRGRRRMLFRFDERPRDLF
jgi:cell wall-associated NlpC family hydrolase